MANSKCVKYVIDKVFFVELFTTVTKALDSMQIHKGPGVWPQNLNVTNSSGGANAVTCKTQFNRILIAYCDTQIWKTIKKKHIPTFI